MVYNLDERNTVQVQLNALQTAALRHRITQADSATAAAQAAQAVVQAYISAVLEGAEVKAHGSTVTDVDLMGITGTITVEIEDAETEGRTEEDRELD